ncbi:MAG TPA: DUF2867 domain-containing protein [Spirochaetota bacterium]|nr:DUF2867 domain-containing protein [Spirochaetota bacterium]HRZ28920.1 DUF2867 domain-containing protein [Spirochaetota bacterium]HSA13895.1 DUF2867 domain-containing protein [Spirochaetota bacterium]
MKKVIKFDMAPAASVIQNGFGKVDYCDSYRVGVPSGETVDEITARAFAFPAWVGFLLRIRDRIVKPFGLKTGEPPKTGSVTRQETGSRPVIFQVVDRNENEIVMGESDRHLDFRVSVLLEKNGSGAFAYMTTIVRFNNMLGRIYFVPVRPFHRIIVNALMKRLN